MTNKKILDAIDNSIKARLCSYDGRKLVWARYVAIKLDLNGNIKIELSTSGFYSSKDKSNNALASEDVQCISLATAYSKEYYPEDLGELGDKIISMFTEMYGDIEVYLKSSNANSKFCEKYSEVILTGSDRKNHYLV